MKFVFKCVLYVFVCILTCLTPFWNLTCLFGYCGDNIWLLNPNYSDFSKGLFCFNYLLMGLLLIYQSFILYILPPPDNSNNRTRKIVSQSCNTLTTFIFSFMVLIQDLNVWVLIFFSGIILIHNGHHYFIIPSSDYEWNETIPTNFYTFLFSIQNEEQPLLPVHLGKSYGLPFSLEIDNSNV